LISFSVQDNISESTATRHSERTAQRLQDVRVLESNQPLAEKDSRFEPSKSMTNAPPERLTPSDEINPQSYRNAESVCRVHEGRDQAFRDLWLWRIEQGVCCQYGIACLEQSVGSKIQMKSYMCQT